MKQLLHFLACLLLASPMAYAQTEEENNPYYYQFEIGQEYYLLGDKVNVRKKADIKGESISILPIGSKIKIEAKDKASFLQSGLRAPWYKVSYKEAGNPKVGYIWGGYIAQGSANSSNDKDLLFLYGVSSILKTMEEGRPTPHIKVQLRACHSQKEISRLEVDAVGELATSSTLSSLGNKGLEGVKEVLHLEFSAAACGEQSGTQVIFWSNNKFNYIRLLSRGFDAPFFATEDFIYPNDEGGQAGLILLKDEQGEYNEEGNPVYERQETLKFMWKNGKLEAIKP